MSLKHRGALAILAGLLLTGCHSQSIADDPPSQTSEAGSQDGSSPDGLDQTSHSSIDPEDTLSAICRGRTPCEEIDRFHLDGPNTAGQEVIEIALHDLHDEGRRPNDPCAPFEHWLIDGDGAARLLLEVCNDGYGMGRGRDQITFEGDLLTHTQHGGSSWIWTTRTTIDLSGPRIVEEYTRGAFSMGINTERARWNWDALAGFVHWKAPICGEEDLVHEPDLDLHDLTNTQSPTYRYDMLPQIAVPDDFSRQAWQSTALGECAIEINARDHTNEFSGQGFVIQGEPGDATDARFHALMGSPTELYLEIIDPNWNFDHESWLHQDHIEVWIGERTSYHSRCLDTAPPSQWAISLIDGTVYSAHGAPDREALRAEVAHHSREHLEKVRLRIEFTEPPEALTIVYRHNLTGNEEDRRIATSDLRSEDAATLGNIEVIEAASGHCIINEEGELEFEDRRRFEGIRPH